MAVLHNNQTFVRMVHMLAVCTLIFTFAGCSQLKDIDKANELQNSDKFAELADLKINCSAKDDGCNKLHLLKGDACFHLSKQANDHNTKKNRLDCAANELSEGIDMTKDWNVAQFYRAQLNTNACEAARLRADFGDCSHFEAMLAKRAKQFIGFASENPGAIYFNARAKFYTLTQATKPCNDLRALETRLASAMQRFSSNPHYAKAYQDLRATVGVETQQRCTN